MINSRGMADLVRQYVACWTAQRPIYSGIWEDNDFGCENLQIFRNGYAIERLGHDELCDLSVLLTKSLRGQINRDHKILWSWCSFLTSQLRNGVPMFNDADWASAFLSLVNLSLAGWKDRPAGPAALAWEQQARSYVNHHAAATLNDKWVLAGPAVFAALEGTLRRKNSRYVGTDGNVRIGFRVTDSNQRPKTYTTGKKLNRIDDSLRLFDQIVASERGRPCTALRQLRNEISTLFTVATDPYDLIDSWRNELVHGQEYWQNRTPIILNLICLLVVDEIEPGAYDNSRNAIVHALEWQRSTMTASYRAPWEIFPPDLDRI